MIDQPFETRLAHDLMALADDEIRPFDVRRIAERAIETGPLQGSHPRVPTLRSLLPSRLTTRRIVLIGLTAALLLALVVLALGSAPSPVRGDTYRAVLIRPAGDVSGAMPYSRTAVDVVLADADGRVQSVRRIAAEDLAPGATGIQLGGTVNEDGWLFLWPSEPIVTPESGPAFMTVLLDLKDPARPPGVIPSNGAMGPRFGPGGLAAVPCGAPPRCDSFGVRQVRILDLDDPDAPARIVNGVPFLGGGPEIIWAADGSGFLARTHDTGLDWWSDVGGRDDGDSWGIKPIDGGPIRPGLPPVIHRRFSADLGFDLDATAGWLRVKQPTGDITLRAPSDLLGTPLSALLSRDSSRIWALLRLRSTGRTELVLERIGPDGSVTEVRRVPTPDDQDPWLQLAPDDSLAAIQVDAGDAGFQTTLLRTEATDVDAPGSTTDGLLVGWVTAEAAERITQAAQR